MQCYIDCLPLAIAGLVIGRPKFSPDNPISPPPHLLYPFHGGAVKHGLHTCFWSRWMKLYLLIPRSFYIL